MFRRTVVI